jgi:hypothetical protein
VQKRKLLPPKRLSESWKLAVLGSLAESMAYLTEAHTSWVIAREEAAGRLEEHFSATLEAWQELVNELALLQRRAVCERGH